MTYSPVNEGKHCLKDLKSLTLRQNTWHVVSACAAEACAHTCWQTRLLSGTHINDDQSQQSPGVLHQPTAEYLYLPPPHFAHKLYILEQSYARESVVYLRGETLKVSDRVFFASQTYLHTMNLIFCLLASCMSLPSCHQCMLQSDAQAYIWNKNILCLKHRALYKLR